MSLTIREHEYASRRIPTYVDAGDPISRAGLASQLRSRSDFNVVEDAGKASVAVIAVDEVDDVAAQSIRSLIRHGCLNVAVVATLLDDPGVRKAVEAGACAIMRRTEATPDRLASVLSREGHGTLPPGLFGSSLAHADELQRHANQRGKLLNGFAEREIEVLRLIADGYDTAEIADQLAYSERTVKNVIHDVTSRFNLRNRCHAVAYALRAGII